MNQVRIFFHHEEKKLSISEDLRIGGANDRPQQPNVQVPYSMNGIELKEIEGEVDVGVLVHKSLKPSRQCEKAANTANAVLRLIQRNFHYRDRHTFLSLYKKYVRPHTGMEFCGPAWAPWAAADIEKLENVQRKAVRMVSGLQNRTYEDRCTELGIQTLENRRKDQDLAQVLDTTLVLVVLTLAACSRRRRPETGL
jgi:hypothetical protein